MHNQTINADYAGLLVLARELRLVQFYVEVN